MSRTAQISRVRKNKPIKVFFKEEHLPKALQSTIPGDHIILENGDYTDINIFIPDHVFMTATNGALVDHDKVTGAYENFVDLNKLARISLSDIEHLIEFGEHLDDHDNPHQVTPSQVGADQAVWNANRILGLQIEGEAQDGYILRYNEDTGKLHFQPLPAVGDTIEETKIFLNDWLSEKTTDDLEEGDVNLYYTDERVTNHPIIQALLEDIHQQNTDTHLSIGTDFEVSAEELRNHLDNALIHYPVDDDNVNSNVIWSAEKIWAELTNIDLLNLSDGLLDYLIEGLKVDFWITQDHYEVGSTITDIEFNWNINLPVDSITIRSDSGPTYEIEDNDSGNLVIPNLNVSSDVPTRKDYYLDVTVGNKTITKEASIWFDYLVRYGATKQKSIDDLSVTDSTTFDNGILVEEIDCSVNGGDNYWFFAWPIEYGSNVKFKPADTEFELTYTEGDSIIYTNDSGITLEYLTFFGNTKTSYSEVEVKVEFI